MKSCSPATIKGRVITAPDSKGVPGAVVSDGKSVTRTDKDGYFLLQVDPCRRKTAIVFVTVPEGYTVPVNEARIPKFFERIENLQAGETREITLELVPVAERSGEAGYKKAGRFIFITDTHTARYANPSVDVEKERLKRQLAQINEYASEADFIITGGDFGDRASPEEFEAHAGATSISSLMIWPAAGNHDLRDVNRDGTYKSLVQNYREFIGPEWYSFDYCGCHFVVLENNCGQKEEDQLEWLKQDLAAVPEGKKIIVTGHMPFNSPEAKNQGGLLDILRKYNVALVLTGHQHSNDIDATVIKGAEHIQTAALREPQDGSPEGFRIINIYEDGNISHEYVPFGIEKSLTLVNPGPDSVIAAGRPFFVHVNAFDTVRKIRHLRYRIDEGGWQPLKRKGLWSWVSERPASGILPGMHRLEVEAEFCAGNRNSDAYVAPGLDEGSAEGEILEKCCVFTAVEADKINKPCAGGRWACMHGDTRRSGHAADIVKPPLRLAWTYFGGGSILAASPSIADGRVFIGMRDENGVKNHAVAAINTETGEPVWRINVAAPVDCAPTVADGVVYVTDIRGNVYAFSSECGKMLWVHRTGMQEDGVQRAWSHAAPVLDNGVVYVNIGHGLLAVEARSGKKIWEFRPDEDGYGDSDRLGAPLVNDGIAYFTGDGRYLCAVSTKTGRELWRYYPSVPSRFRTGPTLSDGCLYLRTERGSLEVIDAKTGRYLWHYVKAAANEGRAYIAVTEDFVVYPAGRYLVCIDKNSHEERWCFRAGGDIESSPAVSGDTVYAGSKDGHFYAVDLKTGQKLWSYAIGTWVNSSPAVSGNMVVIGAYDGNVYCFVGLQQ